MLYAYTTIPHDICPKCIQCAFWGRMTNSTFRQWENFQSFQYSICPYFSVSTLSSVYGSCHDTLLFSYVSCCALYVLWKYIVYNITYLNIKYVYMLYYIYLYIYIVFQFHHFKRCSIYFWTNTFSLWQQSIDVTNGGSIPK